MALTSPFPLVLGRVSRFEIFEEATVKARNLRLNCWLVETGCCEAHETTSGKEELHDDMSIYYDNICFYDSTFEQVVCLGAIAHYIQHKGTSLELR